MSVPYKVRVYEALVRFFRKSLGYIPTKKLVNEMGKGYYRTYRALRALEADGIIIRKSRQSGWRPTLMTSGIYQKLLEIYRRTHLPVPSEALSIHTQYTTRHIRYQLTTLEQAGIVHRKSERTGWQPKRTTEPPAGQRIIDTLHQLYKDQPVTTEAIANQLNISTQHTRRVLAYFEQMEIISRPSSRYGWLPISKSELADWQPKHTTELPAGQRIIDTLHDLYQDHPVTTDAIANQLNISKQHARRLLAYFEQQQIITRPSPRRGWLPISA